MCEWWGQPRGTRSIYVTLYTLYGALNKINSSPRALASCAMRIRIELLWQFQLPPSVAASMAGPTWARKQTLGQSV